MTGAPQPFPWRALERTTRAETRAWAALRRFACAHAPPEALASALRRLLGVPVELILPGRPLSQARVESRPRPQPALEATLRSHVQASQATSAVISTESSPGAQPSPTTVRSGRREPASVPRTRAAKLAVHDATLPSPGANLIEVVEAAAPASLPEVAVAIVAVNASDTRAAIVIEVESALAVELVARGLRRTPPTAVALDKGVTDRLAGAFAAVLASALRHAAPDLPLRVVSAGTPDGVRARHPNAMAGVSILLGLRVDRAAHAVRVHVPAGLLDAPPPPFDRVAMERLGDAPVSLPVVAAASRALAVDIAALAPGDVWVPGGWAAPALRAVALCAPRSERGVRVELGADGRLVLRGDAVALPWEARMDEAMGDPLVDAVGDVPVVVRVEIGTAEMPARAWAALGPGDVVALGRRLGEHAVLRVGGVEVARGELVELDGEIGVRIVARATAGLAK